MEPKVKYLPEHIVHVSSHSVEVGHSRVLGGHVPGGERGDVQVVVIVVEDVQPSSAGQLRAEVGAGVRDGETMAVTEKEIKNEFSGFKCYGKEQK